MTTLFVLSCYEFKKLFERKSLPVIFLLLCALNIFNIARSNYIYNPDTEAGKMEIGRYQLYLNYKGEITQDKIAEIQYGARISEQMVQSGNYDKQYNPDKYYSGYAYGEAMLRIEMNIELDRLLEYSLQTDEISEKAAGLSDEYGMSDYYLKQNREIVDVYQNRNLNSITNSEGLSKLFEYNFSDILIIILLIIGISHIFTVDKENETDVYLKSSRNGGGISGIAKLIAATEFTFIICAVFFTIDLVTFFIMLRIDGLEQPLYILSDFLFTPLSVSLWQYIILYFAAKFIGMLCIAFSVALIAVFVKKAIPTFGLSVLYVGALMFLKALLTNGTGEYINLFNPVSVLLFPELTKTYSVINLFGDPVSVPGLALCGVFAVMALSAAAVICCHVCRQSGRSRIRV